MQKDYLEWSKEKSRINNLGNRPKGFKISEIWYCSIGENIGYEEDGKGDKRLRPVLILQKYGYFIFVGVPLTTKLVNVDGNKRVGEFYYEIEVNGKQNLILLTHIRDYDSSRLVRKICDIPNDEFGKIKKQLATLLDFKF